MHATPNKLSKGQRVVISLTAVPMVATGIAGAVGTFVNMRGVLHSSATSLGLVAAGEGATLVCAMVLLSLTLLGQSTPATVRAGLWVLPLVAAVTGAVVAGGGRNSLVFAVTPLAMTVSAEGLGLVCRRVVAFNTGAERSNGEFLWQANKARNGRNAFTRWRATAAVWRNVRDTTASDGELGAQIDLVRREAVTAAVQGELADVLRLGATPVAPAATLPQLPATEPVAALPASRGVVANVAADMDVAVALGNSWTPSFGSAVVPPVVPPVAVPLPVRDLPTGAPLPDPVTGEALALPPYMTSKDLAAALGKSPATIRSWKHRGKITPVAVSDTGQDLYNPADLVGLRD